MKNRTPSTRQLENLRDGYKERIDEIRRTVNSKVKMIYPEPDTETLLKPVIDKIEHDLPESTKIELDSYRFHQCKRKYKLVFSVWVDPDDVKDPHADIRSSVYDQIAEEATKKTQDLDNWYLDALLAATNKTDIPKFDPMFSVEGVQ